MVEDAIVSVLVALLEVGNPLVIAQGRLRGCDVHDCQLWDPHLNQPALVVVGKLGQDGTPVLIGLSRLA